jgi:hypothetical protein
VTAEPGLTMVPQDFSAVDVGTFGPCAMPDRSIQSGEVFATGQGRGTCASIRATAQFRISWSNGKTSKGTADVVSVGSTIVVRPRVAQGQFAGGPSQSIIFLRVDDPSLCRSTGVTKADYQGQITFAR